MNKTQDRSSGQPREEHTSMTPGNLQGSLQDAYPNHSQGVGLENNIPSRNSKTPNETETKVRRLDASAPSVTSQQGQERPANLERHQNTRSHHHQGHPHHHKGAKGHRGRPHPSKLRSHQIPPQPCCFHCEQDHLIVNCPTFKKKKEFQDFWKSLQQDKERIDTNSPIFLLYRKHGFITSLFLQLTGENLENVIQPSSNDPYAITTNLKDENKNILQLAEKRIFTIRLAKQHLNASKESLDAWPTVYSENQDSEYAETFKEIRTFCDQKLEEVCHVVSLLIDCEADITKLGYVPKDVSTSHLILQFLNNDHLKFFQKEEQNINKYPDETYSHLVRKPLIKYLEEAYHIEQQIEEAYPMGKTVKKAPPHWIITPGLQKLAEHLKEKQKIVFYLQNLRNLCVFLKTRQQAIQPDISLVHRIAPKVRSVVQNLENRIKDGRIAKSLELTGGPGPMDALIAQWTLIKEFENNITQLVLYQTPEQPAEGPDAAKKTKQQEQFRAYIDFLYQYRTTSMDLLQSLTKGARYAFSKGQVQFFDLSHKNRLDRTVNFTEQELHKYGHFPSLTRYPSDLPFSLLVSYYLKEQRALNQQRSQPTRDSTFLPKLYFEKARQRTMDETLFKYETIIRMLQDYDFNEESNPALYQIAINQQQAYKDKIEQEDKPNNLPSLLERLDFRFETLKNTFMNRIELQYPEMELYLSEDDALHPGMKTADDVEKRRHDLELKLVTSGRRYGPLF